MLTWSFGCTATWTEHAAGELDRPVGDDFVRVHVGLGSAAGLPDAQGIIVPPALGDSSAAVVM